MPGFVVHIVSSSEARIAGPVIDVTPARQTAPVVIDTDT